MQTNNKKTQRALLGLLVLVLALALGLALGGCIETGTNYKPSANTGINLEKGVNVQGALTPDEIFVRIEVDCSAAVAAGNETALDIAPEGNLYTGIVAVHPNESMVDALRVTGLKITLKESNFGTYIASINGLEEGAAGPDSGWYYRINGKDGTMSIASLQPQDGDSLKLRYVTSL